MKISSPTFFPLTKHRWRNKEGSRLADFGLDEDAEFYDEENDLPLAEIMRRRKDERGL